MKAAALMSAPLAWVAAQLTLCVQSLEKSWFDITYTDGDTETLEYDVWG